MKVFDLPTPSLVADERILTENIRLMSGILSGSPARLRPHYKSHRCSALAHVQMRSGAVGMTCAKLSEAEDLIFSGIGDVLIANQIVDPVKLVRVAQLAGMCRLTVCVDDAGNAGALSAAAAAAGSTVECLVEYDIGMNRCGARTPEEYLSVARAVAGLPGLRYRGIQAYAGHVSHTVSAAEREKMTRENEKKVADLKEYLGKNGISVETVSGGSTGTCALKASGGVYTELQAGSYLFMDSTYDRLGLPFRNSLFVLATVISRSGGAVILDVGVKGLGADQDGPRIVTADGRAVPGRIELNEEHLKLFDSGWEPAIGERAFVIPGHCCSTVNLYDRIYLFAEDTVTDRLDVTARGMSR
jgi:D-serine deaminase-like pyridoxal phosphate-dependent protein